MDKDPNDQKPQADILPFGEDIESAQPDAQDDQAKFDCLDRQAVDQGKLAAAGEAALEKQWDELLPTLDDMQSHLSQHGANHKRGTGGGPQGWLDWLDSFLERTGLVYLSKSPEAARKKIQRRLRKYRNPEPKPQRTVSVHSPNTEPQHMTFGGPARHDEASYSDAPLKPGDRAGLLNLMLARCAEPMADVLRSKDLNPGARAEILEYVIMRLIQSVCARDRGDGTYDIAIRYVAPEVEDLRGKTLTRLPDGV